MRRILATALLCSLGALGVPEPARAVLPDDLAVGTRVDLEGTLSGPGEVVATEVKLKRGAHDEIQGGIDSVDVAGRSLRVAGVEVALDAGAVVTDEDGREIDLAKVRPGEEAEAEGRFENGVLRAESLEVKPRDEDEAREVEIEGPISEVDSARNAFRVMGLRVLVTPHTRVLLD
jgi:hypothetical protein